MRYVFAFSAFAWLSTLGAPAFAHHSLAAEFDINRPIKLEGVVERMEFSNPHSWLHLEVTTASGERQKWQIEGGPPNSLLRRGWNRNSIPPGTLVRVEGYQALNGLHRANGQRVTLPDGRSLFMSSSEVGTSSEAQ
jgi:hypothetical protein